MQSRRLLHPHTPRVAARAVGQASLRVRLGGGGEAHGSAVSGRVARAEVLWCALRASMWARYTEDPSSGES